MSEKRDFPELNQLKKLIDLLRKSGVTEFKQGELLLRLSDERPPSAYKRRKYATTNLDSPDLIIENPYSAEDVLNWSSAGIPQIQGEQ